jgi:L-asparagine transporter-like permease
MNDIVWKLTQVDDYTITVVVMLVVLVFALIRTLLDSFTMAVVFTPALFFGGLAANYLFRTLYITSTSDKDTNVVIASAVGVLSAMVLMLIATWLMIVMSDYRSRRRKVPTMAAEPVEPAVPAAPAE